MDRENQRVMSLRLSRVMEDIGVNRYIIARRRRTWLVIEKQREVLNMMIGTNHLCYHFGSQSEGNTTSGMDSDIDVLLCNFWVHVILKWSDWKQGNHNLLVIKNAYSPPQHCLLQIVRHDLPLPRTKVEFPSDVVDNEGRVLHTNTQAECIQAIRDVKAVSVIVHHGPSKSWDENNDLVFGFHCASLPRECQFMFNRPRPGHWPRADTLATARQTGVFLVPQGYSESPSRPTRCRSTALHTTLNDPYYPQSKWQWRFSTSMIERWLMFDMNTQQHKTFVFLKTLRKQFFKPVVGDRLSTFHLKTTMLYTIETYPPEIWRDDNLVQCVIYCLTTLLRCLKIKYCPHYTIYGVNLFTGKLFKHEQTVIRNMILKMIRDNMICVFSIQIDDIGRRMSTQENCVSLQPIKTRRTNNTLISTFLVQAYKQQAKYLNEIILNESDKVDYVLLLIQHIAMLTRTYDQGTSIEQEAASLLKPQLCGTLASVLASRTISQSQPVTPEILNMYEMSFDSDLLSNRLKFASMLYCKGQYKVARNCLTFCEGLLGPEVWQCCFCQGRLHDDPSREFQEKTSYKSNKEMLKHHSTCCVSFSRNELCCVPLFLVYEMFRTVGNEDRQERRPFFLYKWIDYIVIDCVPFLYYLQYLTYRQLNKPDRQEAARDHLEHYVVDESECHGHIDTAFNMLGHCYELDNRFDLAWLCYQTSLGLNPRNNAAYWHESRLLN